MILSVVIVSYNVKFFLEQCLSSLKKAVEGSSFLNGQTEVFVVDNASADNSLDFLIPLFPGFRFIQNKENTGFAKANNQALTLCTGEFVLFLNPDTIIAEDSLDICVSFFRSMPDAGALGIQMIDGTGKFLKESKRGFPTPAASFFRMSGFARLFPRSKVFAAYYMGNLPESGSHTVDILSGAFMMVRKNILDRIGGFDERFFMYAEDIDLSFRIIRAGHRNYYLSDATMIHFKGESTKKDFQYIKLFYTAMSLFMKKHFMHTNRMQRFLLFLGIRLHQVMISLVIPFRKTKDNSANQRSVFIRSSGNLKQLWKENLAEKHIPVSESENEADAILFCESTDQSWKTIIREITDKKSRFFYIFSGTGTHAAVGTLYIPFRNSELYKSI
jgi:N-acetylglucosaminyl-diphospho-decaprenol L-rhamnosyltransferase